MSSYSEPFLVAAFFDQPHLLAVRFKHPGTGGRLAQFTMTRQPDSGGFGCVGIGATVIIGLAAAGLLVTTMHGCTRTVPNRPVIIEPTSTNCRNTSQWESTLSELAESLSPRREDLKPYFVRTLLDIPRDQARAGNPTAGWLKPRHAAADEIAHRRGRALAKMLMASGIGPEVAVILDLPGPQSIAAAAAMSIDFDPVICIDNLPHPAGVVPAAQTLAAAVYWAPEFIAARAGHDQQTPAVFVLEGERLAPYQNQADRFDNRSYARLPDAYGFKTLGIKRLLYVRERAAEPEADDLNNLFVVCVDQDIEVRHLALETMDAVPTATTSTPTTSTSSSGGYGNHIWFWSRYGWGMPQNRGLTPVQDPDAAYRTSLRPTRWSTRTEPLDGGARRHSDVITRLTKPPDSGSSGGSSGGSWGRSSSSSWGG